jgi:hypothetical protein
MKMILGVGIEGMRGIQVENDNLKGKRRKISGKIEREAFIGRIGIFGLEEAERKGGKRGGPKMTVSFSPFPFPRLSISFTVFFSSPFALSGDWSNVEGLFGINADYHFQCLEFIKLIYFNSTPNSFKSNHFRPTPSFSFNPLIFFSPSYFSFNFPSGNFPGSSKEARRLTKIVSGGGGISIHWK